MGRNKKPTGRPKSAAQYQVVQQSYEDKDYEDRPKPVLVPTAVLNRRRRPPAVRFGEDLPEDYADKRNMLVTDDAVEDRIFEDEVEEDFDQDFIMQMMQGPADGEEGEDDDQPPNPEDFEEDHYPKHEEMRATEKQFEKMMADFDMDEDLDESDPRAHGPLDVAEYGAALEQFVRQHADTSELEDLPVKHRGLINQLRRMADGNRIFDSNAQGEFLTLAPNSQTERMLTEYRANQEALRKETLQQLRKGMLQPTEVTAMSSQKTPIVDAPSRYAEGDALVAIKVKPKAQFDCETVLTTYSTLYNHPNVIAANKKKVKLSNKSGLPTESMNREKKEAEAAAAKAAEEARAGAGCSNSDEEEEEYVAVPGLRRPEDETPEEKKARRKQVKEAQRQRRLEKKALKGAYKKVEEVAVAQAPKRKQDKAQIGMSVVKGGGFVV